MKTAYYTVDDEIIAESINGVRLDYLTDALGSVTAKVDQSASVTSTARYKPYGSLFSGNSYTFGWSGVHGYRASQQGTYIRSRQYQNATASWITVDELWPSQPAYIYANGSPSTIIDPSGMYSITRNLATGDYNEYDWPPNCGDYHIEWNFAVRPSATGWLVQQIDVECDIFSCDGGIRKCCPSYFEVWLVFKGEVMACYGKYFGARQGFNDDQFSNDQGGPCTVGFEVTKGQLAFFPDSKASLRGDNKWLKDHHFAFLEDANHVACSGYAPSTLTFSSVPPPIWSNKAESYVGWGCCKDPDEDSECVVEPGCKKCAFDGPCIEEQWSLTY